MNLLTNFEVFKTNVEDHITAKNIIQLLGLHYPGLKINFDLWDKDRILRIEGNDFNPQNIIRLVEASGFSCSTLEEGDH